jgi:MFS family permease
MQSTRSPWIAMWALCACFFMIMLDSTIVTVAIPAMLDGLDANLNEVVWVNSVYLLANTVPLLITGRLATASGPSASSSRGSSSSRPRRCGAAWHPTPACSSPRAPSKGWAPRP